jgi:hypothetical protein
MAKVQTIRDLEFRPAVAKVQRRWNRLFFRFTAFPADNKQRFQAEVEAIEL